MPKPVIAIVGRPNVGKSTLFNRITGGRVAIVDDMPGVTRDRMYREGTWLNKPFTLIDTGGLEFEDEINSISSLVKMQVQVAIDEADLIIFVVDGKIGLTPDDHTIATMLRKSGKPIILAVNKIDNFSTFENYEFYTLGLGDPIAISAEHKINIGDLLDQIMKNLPHQPEEEFEEDIIKVAVVGKPNVGKSSLINKILGEDRVIVSSVPGTTRDAIDTLFEHDGQKYVLIDTAGMRRRAKIHNPTERYSVIRSLRAIDRSDVALILIDSQEGVTEQDKKIAGYVHEAGKSSIIVVNKWDLIKKDNTTMNEFDKSIREELGFMQYAPTAYISAFTGQRVMRLFELIRFVSEQANYRVPTPILNDFIRDIVAFTPPPTDKGNRLKILYVTQSSVKPPTFRLFVNNPELFHFSYKRHVENQLRKAFGFEGNPIRLDISKRGESQ
ncbi:ribosome biogenesis GTPase Der [Desulfitibacter alkalitolerans]|uniref:ribosome biogenesis GTPase Der n=1 Tax=Desulfitibacter alkalitolerans TaxID=264641 RepID=UPI00048894CC|nr:ribosome biogenesis GTPase Der [Desulfitibacter alkalitolerans]